jgi:hypothetical protein
MVHDQCHVAAMSHVTEGGHVPVCKEWKSERTNCKDEEDSWKEQSSSEGEDVK